MSKQFNAYLVETDVMEIHEIISSICNKFVYTTTFSNNRKPVCSNSPIKNKIGWDNLIIIFEKDSSVLKPRKTVSGNEYWFEHIGIPSIEFSTSYFSPNPQDSSKIIRGGRFYFNAHFVVDGQWYRYEDSIIKCVDTLFRRIKRRLTRRDDAYFGKQALKYAEAGWKLE